jgi:ketosteroid isomerase-like protein
MSTVSELQASAWDAESRHDFDALLDHFLPDATFHQSDGREHRGHAAIRTMTEDFCRAYPGCEVEILREYGDGETSAAIEFRATITDVEGNVSILQGVQLVELKDGKFKSVRGYEEQPVPMVTEGQS